MKSYLTLVPRYLTAHKKKTRLAIVSVAISVALVTGVFSMLDAFMQFEKKQVIKDYGNYHLAVFDASEKERSAIESRIEVQNSGEWIAFNHGVVKEMPCAIGALDKNFASNMNIRLIEGRYPVAKEEIMLEQWAAERLQLEIGGEVELVFANKVTEQFKVAGFYNDFGHNKASGVPGIILSTEGAKKLQVPKRSLYLVEFKEEVNIKEAIQDIKEQLKIAGNRVDFNNHLLAVIGQSDHKAATGLYTIGAILFFIVLIAGVVMIYNTFNISVMDRVRQFGLLRCIGATQSQIKRLVRQEGLFVILRAIPLGLAAGMLITVLCSAILKFYNSTLFSDIPLFTLSPIGIGSGTVLGFLTVFVASLLPAKKAAQVSPIVAVAGSADTKFSKVRKQGILTKVLPAEIAMGINNALMKKKTLFLMSASIAISIILFLGFNVFVDFMHTSLKTTKPYTPDITLSSDTGIGEELYTTIAGIEGVKRAYGRKLTYIEAAFKADRLTDRYREMQQNIEVRDGGLIVPPEKSWLISYDEIQLEWAETDLIDGVIDEEELNSKDGIIAVAWHLRNNVSMQTTDFKLGDKVYIETPNGTKEFTVMGLLRSAPFNSGELALTTFITTEKLFTQISGETQYKAVDIQLGIGNQQEAVRAIKGILDKEANLFNKEVTLLDKRQKNAEMDQTFLTMAVFVYGFVAVIALISVLNILNTMNTSVAVKTRYLGVMRAIGMSGRQLKRMVLVEAATYCSVGFAAGCVFGVMLQKWLINNYLASFKVPWKFPLEQIIIILIVAMAMTVISVIRPLRRLDSRNISEVVNSI